MYGRIAPPKGTGSVPSRATAQKVADTPASRARPFRFRNRLISECSALCGRHRRTPEDAKELADSHGHGNGHRGDSESSVPRLPTGAATYAVVAARLITVPRNRPVGLRGRRGRGGTPFRRARL